MNKIHITGDLVEVNDGETFAEASRSDVGRILSKWYENAFPTFGKIEIAEAGMTRTRSWVGGRFGIQIGCMSFTASQCNRLYNKLVCNT